MQARVRRCTARAPAAAPGWRSLWRNKVLNMQQHVPCRRPPGAAHGAARRPQLGGRCSDNKYVLSRRVVPCRRPRGAAQRARRRPQLGGRRAGAQRGQPADVAGVPHAGRGRRRAGLHHLRGRAPRRAGARRVPDRPRRAAARRTRRALLPARCASCSSDKLWLLYSTLSKRARPEFRPISFCFPLAGVLNALGGF